MILVVCGLLTIGLSYHQIFNSPEEKIITPVAAAENNSSASNKLAKPAMPVGFQSQQITRDPFLLPSNLQDTNDSNKQQINNRSAADNTSSNVSTKKANTYEQNLKLTGIAVADGARLAVIRSANNSQAYQVNETVSGYKIVAISDDSVTLIGPNGQRTIMLDTVAQKGEDKNAK